MKAFELITPSTLEEAAAILSSRPMSVPMAGGTDLLGGLKYEIYETYPSAVVSLKDIKGLDYIIEAEGCVRIGAMTTLTQLAESSLIRERFAALSEAARRTASPQLRNMGTLGGNISQDVRCWYFRAKNNEFDCRKKGGRKCFAPLGDNRYHSIFGASKGCFAVNPSDTAPALCALDARIVTTSREIPAEDFWDMGCPGSTVLERGELVKEIVIPDRGAKSAFEKFAIREAIDFPIVNCAAASLDGEVRIFLNAVYYKPYRALKAEQVLSGRRITPELAVLAAEEAVSGAKPLSGNAAKLEQAKAVVKAALLACR